MFYTSKTVKSMTSDELSKAQLDMQERYFKSALAMESMMRSITSVLLSRTFQDGKDKRLAITSQASELIYFGSMIDIIEAEIEERSNDWLSQIEQPN